MQPGTQRERTLTTVTLGNPGAGFNIQKFPENNSRWRVVSVGFIFNTDATVADRRVELRIQLGGHIWRFTCANVQPASKVYTYSFHAGLAFPTGLQGDYLTVYQGLPMWLEGGNMGPITTETVNMQSGDIFTAGVMLVEEGIQL